MEQPYAGEGCPGSGGPQAAGLGGALLARQAARQAARRARKTAERRAVGLGRRLRGGWAEWEARESTRLVSTDSVRST